MKPWVLALVALGALSVIAVVALVGALAYVGLRGPPTYVVEGSRMRRHHVEAIRELGLLEEDEDVEYFYSDALVDVRGGMYFVTDRKLVLYCDVWDEPRLVAPFEAIASVEVEWEDSWLTDSLATVTLTNGDGWTFPLSTENDGDHAFHDYLAERIGGPVEAADPARPTTAPR